MNIFQSPNFVLSNFWSFESITKYQFKTSHHFNIFSKYMTNFKLFIYHKIKNFFKIKNKYLRSVAEN